jgi:MYXO-CTERM domain-containing protein
MKFWKLFSTAAMVSLLASAALATVTINELRVDDASTDTDEYFELAGTPGESLNGLWYLVIGDFSTGAGNGGRSGQVEWAFDLTGNSIAPDGHFLVGSASLGTDVPAPDAIDITQTPTFENSDNVTHMLVSAFSGTQGTTDIDTDDDGVPDGPMPWSSILDSIALVETANPPTTTDNEWSYAFGGPAIGPDGGFMPAHVYRLPDASGGWNIGPFGLAADPLSVEDTPGVVNPEPATFGLLIAGAALALRRRR